MALHQPLDLEYWLINMFSGNIEIFSVLSLFVISAMAGYFKMNSIVYGMFIMVFTVILSAAGFNALLILLILIFAPILFWWTRRLVE